MSEDKTNASLSTYQSVLLQEENTGKDKRKLQAEVPQNSQQIAFLADFCILSVYPVSKCCVLQKLACKATATT